ncbi:MAG: GNAT family N-acetyltransferase [Bacteroidia bacterium]|nr:GNAT family N-acetyltransferase [Bacteroidia bacterium]
MIRYTPVMIQDQVALEKLQVFLRLNKLPADDIKLEGSLYFGYHDEGGDLAGSGGLELYGTTALLRSVAVQEKSRNRTLGNKIVEDIIYKAKSLKIKEIYLLTETAHDYFINKGFQDVSREFIPETIKRSAEFSHVCPTSALAMKFTISK